MIEVLASVSDVEQLGAGVDVMSRLLRFGDETISTFLAKERASDSDMRDLELAVCDSEGRPFRGARIVREPGSYRFAIILLTPEGPST